MPILLKVMNSRSDVRWFHAHGDDLEAILTILNDRVPIELVDDEVIGHFWRLPLR